jgi:DNA-binding CsgD family transcriptional regulator
MLPSVDRSDKTLAADVRDALATVGLDVRPALPVVLDPIRDLLRAERAGGYRVSWHGAGWSTDWIHFAHYPGVDAHLAQVRAFWHGAPRRFAVYDPIRPEPKTRNVAMRFDRVEVARFPIGQALERVGLGDQSQCRMLLCEGSRLLAWLGVFRREAFGLREERLFTALAPALHDRLVLERSLDTSHEQAASIDALLEAVPFPAMLVRAGAGVQQANAAGAAMLDGRFAGLVKAVDDHLRGAGAAPPGATINKVSQPGVPALALVVYRGARFAAAGRRGRAVRRWNLTSREADVLAHLADGASNKEIAARCGCALKTVEQHVSAILAKAALPSRAALVRAFWSPR